MSEIEVDPPRRRRRRGSLTPERVLDAAFTLAEEQGLTALTMPDLASHLDVGVTGLYWYYRTKDDLIRAMSMPAMTRLDGLMARPAGEDPQNWQDFLRRYFERLREVYREHPVLADIMLMRPSPHDTEAVLLAYGAVENVVAYLTDAGFAPETAWYLFSTATHFTQSTVIADRSRAHYGEPLAWLQDSGSLTERGWSTLASLSARSNVDLDMTGDRGFEAGLAMIIRGAASVRSPAGDADG